MDGRYHALLAKREGAVPAIEYLVRDAPKYATTPEEVDETIDAIGSVLVTLDPRARLLYCFLLCDGLGINPRSIWSYIHGEWPWKPTPDWVVPMPWPMPTVAEGGHA